MTLEDFEREEEDRVQYEMQLAGQGGKRWGMFSSGSDRHRKPTRGPVRVQSSENYMLSIENYKR